MIKIKEKLNEILLAYYIFSYVLLKRIIPNYSEISTNVLLINVIVILITSLIYNKLKIKFMVKEIIIYLVIIFYALLDYNFRPNIYTVQTYSYMIIFAIIPIFLYLRIDNLQSFFSSYSFFSIVIAILFILDPFYNYKYSGDYMGFGYNTMILVYIGLYIKIRENKSGMLLKALLVIVFVELLIFSNKGAILSAILFTLLYELWIKGSTKKKIVMISIGVILVLGFNTIIEVAYNIAVNNNINSYSIRSLQQVVDKTASGLSGRENIWKEAQIQIENNLVFGNGAGYYRTTNNEGMYTHNIVYDVLIEYGIVMFAILTILVLKGIMKIRKERGEERLVGIIFLIMWFPKLFFSSYLQAEIGFWLFLIWGIVNRRKDNIERTIKMVK